jgi:subfamily B ATP-binding cassette protein MsbA
VALLFALLYAGARNLRAYLVKPLFDEVLVPQQAGGEPSPMERWLPSFGDPPRTAPEPGGTVAAEEASRERIRASLWRVTLAGLVVILIIPLAHFGKDYLVQHTLGRVLVDIQQSLCRKLLALPLRFHHGTSRGDTLSRIMNDVARAHFALDLLFADVFQAVLAIGVGLAILISISWQLTLVSLVTVPLVVGVITLFGQRIRRSAQRRQEKLSDVTQRLMQILAGIKVIQAFRAEEQESAAFARENRALFRRSMKVVKNRVLARSVVEGLNNSIGVGVLILGALLVLNGLWGLTPGDLAAFVTVMATTYRPTKALTKGWAQLMDSLPAAERFFELLDEPPGVVDAPDAMRLDGVRRGIRISKVSFSYGREPVLRDVTVDAPVGSVIAIVGRTGSGKTTLADLLLRLYDPVSGSIEIDGIDLRRIARDSLLDHVAVVTQEPFLFNGTIRDNILYGRPSADAEDVERAARAAHVDEFAKSLPEGYDTEVGEAGVRLSGGQRQRITIARAILKNPSILIFDEATSALDAKSERYVQEAIESLLSGRTVFVIAHRLSTIRHADQIVVLENGSVSATGTHEALMAAGGLYQELVSLQGDSR